MYQVRKGLVLLLMVMTLGSSAFLHAAVLENFYQVEIPAREGQDRSAALREAFDLMITRQAGSAAVDSDAVSEARQDPRAFLRRSAGMEEGGVRVEFEPTALRDLLTQAGLPVLGPNRPTVMLWAVEEGDFAVELLGQSSGWSEVLSDAAEHRAVALGLPLADLEDRSKVEVEDIQQANAQALKNASERYDATAVLALTIAEDSGRSVLNWSWWLNDQVDSGRITAESQAEAADQLMLAVADQVFNQYAVAPSSSSDVARWEMVVEGIDSASEFAALQRTLQQLGSKVPPSVLSVQGEQVRLGLDFPGTESQLERLLALDQRLRRMPAPEPAPERLQASEGDSAPDGMNFSVASDDGSQTSQSRPDDSAPADAAVMDKKPEAELRTPAPAANVMYFRWR